MRTLKILFLLVLLLLGLPLLGQSEEYLIKIKFSEARLFLFSDREETIADFPIGLPMLDPKVVPIDGEVMRIERNPYWYPTEGIRKAYFKKHNKELSVVVEPGDPRNAMGVAKIIIAFKTPGVHPLIRIHGTNEDESVGQRISRGCIRMFNKDILVLIEIIDGKQTRVLFEK